MHRERKGERGLAGAAAITPLRRAIIVDAELQVSPVRLIGRGARVALQREMKAAPLLGIVLADKIPWQTIRHLVRLHPHRPGEIARAQPWCVFGRNFERFVHHSPMRGEITFQICFASTRPQMLVEKCIRRLTLRRREGMPGIRIAHREPVRGLEHLAIHRQCRRETIAHAGHFKVRRIMQWRIHKHRARSQRGQHLGEIKGNLRRHITIHRLDARHVIAAAPGAHVAAVVLRKHIEPAARHHRLHPCIKHGEKQRIMPAERMTNDADGFRIDIRQRLQHIHPAPVIDDALHRRAVILQRIRIGLVFHGMNQRVVEHEADVAALRQFVRISTIRACC